LAGVNVGQAMRIGNANRRRASSARRANPRFLQVSLEKYGAFFWGKQTQKTRVIYTVYFK
jgi:hypothetical protein